ncbi:MAG TPA: hypothetical protein VN325_07925 [Steroidobacteraceae bacterium]|nr:hypothetical protein [Steroidobacteraceae bacterium]
MIVCVLLGPLGGCAEISGYPADPENSGTVMRSLEQYLDPAIDAEYNKASGDARKAKRDLIVLSRMRAFNIQFDKYEKNLWGDGNSVTLGGDLTALALTGLATTAAAAASKTAFSAAATGVIGANAAINKDLYYQRTLPALIAQMEAERSKVQRAILVNLQKPDSDYPLAAAEIDLDALKKAGSMPSAIANVTQAASADKQTQALKLDEVRSLPVSTSSSTSRLKAWVAASQSNYDLLQAWMQKDTVDPVLNSMPPPQFIGGANPTLESDRMRAISDLKVP